MNRFIRNAILFLIIISVLTACTGQSGSSKTPTRTVFAMDTVMNISAETDEATLDEVTGLIRSIEARLSTTADGSDIAQLNSAAPDTHVSPWTSEAVREALSLCERTGGALDISIYPVVKAWGFTTDAHRVPGEGELQGLLENVDYSRISQAEDLISLPAGMQIDLGSIAKGYTGDRVIELLRSHDVRSAVIDLGGNIQTIGTKPDGSEWHIAIANPLMPDSYIGYVKVTDAAVITSGTYQRFFEQDGVVYHHIIDPATGCPARSGLTSVTVVGLSGTTCDALSTALFVMGPDRAAAFYRESDDFEAVFVKDDGTVTITEGLTDIYVSMTGITPDVIRR